jgi:transposase-like protein
MKPINLTDLEAVTELLYRLRWGSRNPSCPFCGHQKIYMLSILPPYKCAKCRKKFSLTTNSYLASSKIDLCYYAKGALLYSHGITGPSELASSLSINYKVAYLLILKFHEAHYHNPTGDYQDLLRFLLTHKPTRQFKLNADIYNHYQKGHSIG